MTFKNYARYHAGVDVYPYERQSKKFASGWKVTQLDMRSHNLVTNYF